MSNKIVLRWLVSLFLFISSGCALLRSDIQRDFYFEDTRVAFLQPSSLSTAVPINISKPGITKDDEEFTYPWGLALGKFRIDYGGGFLKHVDSSQQLIVSLRKYSNEQNETSMKVKLQLDVWVNEHLSDGFSVSHTESKINEFSCFNSDKAKKSYITCLKALNNDVYVHVISIYSVYVDDQASYRKAVEQNFYKLVNSVVIDH